MNPVLNTIAAARIAQIASLGVELLVAAGIMAVLVLLMLSIKYEVRRRRRKAEARRPMSAGDFIAAVDAEPKYNTLCLAVREEFAVQTKLPVDVVFPSDTIVFLESFAGGGFETADIIRAIENGLDMPIPEEIANKMPYPHRGFRTVHTTLADCIRGFIECEEFAALLDD
jgi:hypothetical protein